MARLFTGLVVLVLATVLAACGGGGGGGGGGTPAPSLAITSQPVDVAVTAGQAATFHVSTNVAATYRWQRNDGAAWADIPGATADSYSIASPQVSDNGAKLRVVVTATSNAASTLTSSAVTLSVVAAPQPPAIVVAPADVAAVEGTDAVLNVTASGTAVTYRWQRSADGSTWADVDGATSATLSLSAVALGDDGARFRVIVANSLGSLTSGVAQLHVTPAPVAPTFSAMPADVTVVAPNPATFTVAVAGTPAPTLAWQVSTDGAQWTTLAGETGTSLVLASVSTSDSGKRFRAVATNASGQVESVGALLTVTPQPVAAFIATSPADTSVGIGATPVFHVAAGGTPAPTLQWQVSSDGGATFLNVTGATGADLALPAVSSADDGKRVRAVATNATGSATSASALLTVRPAPHITQQPESQAWRAGLPTPQFTVAGAGSGLTFKWQMRIVGASSFTDIAGATSSTIAVTPPAADAQVRAIVTNATGDSATSQVAALTRLHWALVAPEVSAEEMAALRWLDATTVLAVGATGSVIRSADAGQTWNVVVERDAAHTVDLQGLGVAPAGQVAVAVGAQGLVLRSADGGVHWLTMRAAAAGAADLHAVSFVDATTVVAASNDGSVLRSVDAGLTWASVDTGQSDGIWAMEFRANVGLALTNFGTILRTINGGAQWSAVATGTSATFNSRIAFASSSVVMITGAGSVQRSTDAGLTWQTVSVNGGFFPGDVAFSDALHGFELPSSDAQTAFSTADGGLTWTAVAGWPYNAIGLQVGRFDSVRFNAGGVGVATGAGGALLRTADGGQTWTRVDPSVVPNRDTFRSAAFATSTTGAAVSETQLYTTTDAGAHWTRVAAADHSGSATWVSVLAIDAAHLMAVDTAGQVLGSNDAGASWTARTATRPLVFNGNMAFADLSVGFVVTEDGVIQRTTDGGATWATVFAPTPSECFDDVSLASRTVAVASTCSGELYRTADGGATWTQVRGILGTPATVTFSAADNGVAAGLKYFSGTSAQMLQHTRDGGATWQEVTPASATANFGKPWFVSATEGFVVSGAEIWHTTDGGATWTLDSLSATGGAGVALDANTSMTFGGRGVLMKRTN